MIKERKDKAGNLKLISGRYNLDGGNKPRYTHIQDAPFYPEEDVLEIPTIRWYARRTCAGSAGKVFKGISGPIGKITGAVACLAFIRPGNNQDMQASPGYTGEGVI